MERRFNKIFCIGKNKTGTTSLHRALEALGFKSLSWAPLAPLGSRRVLATRNDLANEVKDRIKENLRLNIPMLNGIDEYDAYSDIGKLTENFVRLDKDYPGSVFIYTDRETTAWIASRRKHINRRIEAISSGKISDNKDYLIERLQKSSNDSDWRKSKEDHKASVLEYFKDRPNDLLIIDITAGDGYQTLCPFLNVPIPEEAFPWENRIVSKSVRTGETQFQK